MISSAADSAGNLIIGSSDGFLYDLAIGGANGTPPATTVTSPASGSVIPNPGSKPVRGRGHGHRRLGAGGRRRRRRADERRGRAVVERRDAPVAARPRVEPTPARRHGFAAQLDARGARPPQGSVLTFTARAVGADGLVDTRAGPARR